MKYLGSKSRFARELLPIILAGRRPGQWYVEPFAGGCNLIDKVKGPRLAGDLNPYLIAMWKALVYDGWQPRKFSREEYYQIRDNPADYPAEVVGFVGVNCSYCGRWFSAFSGETKTKLGTVRDYQGEAMRNLAKQVPNLRGVRFVAGEYKALEIPAASIIYCDPPYLGVYDYKAGFNHAEFWEWVRGLSTAGHTVFVSEYAAPPDFTCLWSGAAKSSLSANGKAGGSKQSTERLFRFNG